MTKEEKQIIEICDILSILVDATAMRRGNRNTCRETLKRLIASIPKEDIDDYYKSLPTL